jgi:hypothetical protein
MRRVESFKIGLALCALVLFALSIRSGVAAYRLAAIVCLLGAFLLRFIRPRA